MTKQQLADRDVQPSRLAVELGVTEAEARELKKRVEFSGCCFVMPRWVVVGRVELKAGGR
jgi:hypothetical protein